jgi:hypothetical protein
MPCGWGYGVWLTGHEMRAHFTKCPNRPAASGDVERRWRTFKVKRGLPAGPLMKYGWGCGQGRTGAGGVQRREIGISVHNPCPIFENWDILARTGE